MTITMTRMYVTALLSATTFLTACNLTPTSWKTPNMTTLSPRLQPLFEKTKAVCFGRFVMDVPETVEVVWGSSMVPFEVKVFAGRGSEIGEKIAQRESKLKSEIRYPASKKLPMYFETIDGVRQDQRMVISQREFDTTGDFRIESFLAMDKDLFVITAYADEQTKGGTLADLNDMARRLRPRTETEIPAEPGICIEHAFLPDHAGPAKEKQESEHIRIGFRLKEFPDVHLSIYMAPANPYVSESNTLKYQLQRQEDNAAKEGRRNEYLKLKFLRKSSREIHDWQGGFEALSRTPEEEQSRSYHDFVMDFQGVPYDLFKPYADIRLQTGVEHDAAGATKASLTDEEAIALWDKLTSSIRVRKASDASIKPVSAVEPPKTPLGELAATGRTCPQTGWWQCSEGGEVAGGKRQHFTAGQRMPRAVLLGEPSIWQKFKNERPSHKTATVWQLVDYDAVPVVAKAETATPPHADAQGTPPGDAEDASPPSEG